MRLVTKIYRHVRAKELVQLSNTLFLLLTGETQEEKAVASYLRLLLPRQAFVCQFNLAIWPLSFQIGLLPLR